MSFGVVCGAMPIPDYQSLMLPLLELTASNPKGEFSLQESINALADRFNLTDEQRRHLLPSGRQSTFVNRVGWAATYLRKAGLLEATRRGYFKIPRTGLDVVAQNPPAINVRFLKQFPEFVEF